MRRTVLLVATMALTLLVASGVALAATLVGTENPETIVGTPNDDWIEGNGGGDALFGEGGQDRVGGGFGDDLIRGGPGDDRVEGQSGDDRVEGQSGSDVVEGGGGADLLRGGTGGDNLDGISGELSARGDEIHCGEGMDTVDATNNDFVAADCETVRVPDLGEAAGAPAATVGLAAEKATAFHRPDPINPCTDYNAGDPTSAYKKDFGDIWSVHGNRVSGKWYNCAWPFPDYVKIQVDNASDSNCLTVPKKHSRYHIYNPTFWNIFPSADHDARWVRCQP